MNTPLTLRHIRQARVAAAVAAALLVAAPAAPTFAESRPATPAARASKSEATGVASGFAVGAAAGGPIGALVGAAAGGWLGDRMHRERQSLEHSRDQLAEARLRGAGLTMNVMFRTDESSVTAGDEPLLAQFAALAATTPGAGVHVTGFADPRGTPRYNAALAAERATSVAARLVAAGVPPERLVVNSETAVTTAAGAEPVAALPDLDGYALQRRVTLQIVLPMQGRALEARRR
jgi:outer membrane protein OmpA-like peptidoglycan-associated protein